MNFQLTNINHKFTAYPNTLFVRLSITLADFKDLESSEITVAIESPGIKTLSVAEIETLAIARARILLG